LTAKTQVGNYISSILITSFAFDIKSQKCWFGYTTHKEQQRTPLDRHKYTKEPYMNRDDLVQIEVQNSTFLTHKTSAENYIFAFKVKEKVNSNNQNQG